MPAWWARSPGAPLGLGLLVFVVMGPALWAPFVYDDVALILGNPDVTGPWQGLRHFLLESFAPGEAYEPVIAAAHRLLFFLVGGAPAWYRATSLLLHWLNCWLLLLLFRELIKPPEAALPLAALFALYPAHTEVLAVSTFKKHLVVALCGLSMLHLERPWREAKASRARRAAAFACLALALFTKEHGLMLPPILLAASLALAPDWRGRLRRDAGFHAGLLAAALAFVWWRAAVVPRAVSYVVGGSWPVHLLTSAKILFWYLREAALPWRLCQEHWLRPVAGWLSWEAAAVAAALAAGAAGLAALWRRDRVAFAGLAAALLWLAPFLNLYPYLNISLVANRYLYLAFAGLLLCAGRLGAPAWKIQFLGLPAPLPAMAALALAYAGLSMRNLARYSDPVELWARAVDCAPEHARARGSLAGALAGRGRLAEAEREARQACRLGRGVAVSGRVLLVNILAERGDCRRAAPLAEAIQRDKTGCGSGAEAAKILGACRLAEGSDEAAREALTLALRLDPRDGMSRINLGRYYERVKDPRRAELQWISAQWLPGARADALNALAGLYARQGRLGAARKAYEDSLAARPLQPDAAAELAGLYARSGERGKGLQLLDSLLGELRARAAAAARLSSELSPAEQADARDAIAAAHGARAGFLRRHAAP